MSRPGNPWDDALAESFFKTLKRELMNGKGYKTREEAKQDAFKHIKLHCNRRRMHSSIGYNAPCDLERDAACRSLFFRPRNIDQSTPDSLFGPGFPPQSHMFVSKLPPTGGFLRTHGAQARRASHGRLIPRARVSEILAQVRPARHLGRDRVRDARAGGIPRPGALDGRRGGENAAARRDGGF